MFEVQYLDGSDDNFIQQQISERGMHPVSNARSPKTASSRQLRENTKLSHPVWSGNTSGLPYLKSKLDNSVDNPQGVSSESKDIAGRVIRSNRTLQMQASLLEWAVDRYLTQATIVTTDLTVAIGSIFPSYPLSSSTLPIKHHSQMAKSK
jgi:hypothetical protein